MEQHESYHKRVHLMIEHGEMEVIIHFCLSLSESSLILLTKEYSVVMKLLVTISFFFLLILAN